MGWLCSHFLGGNPDTERELIIFDFLALYVVFLAVMRCMH